MIINEEKQIEDLLNLNNYNREQRLAIFSDRHNFISANAGSGKTTVLIRKYIYELMKNKIVAQNPENIVAITFTNKAASDMLKKAYQSFEELLADTKDKEVIKKQVEKIYRNLSKSRISTIHSFCGDIIRRYPLEARLVPGFKEVNSDILKKDIEEIILKHFKLIINNENNKYNKELQLLEKLDINLVKNHVINLINHRNKFNNIDDLLKDKNKFIDGIKEVFSNLIKYRINQLIASLEEAQNVVDTYFDDSNKNKYFDKKPSFNNIVLDIKNQLKNSDIENIDILRLKSIKVLKPLFINYLMNALISFDYSIIENIKIIDFNKEILSIEKDIKLLNSPEEILTAQVRDIKTHISIAKEINEKVEEFKSEENIVDFDNILYLANNLLDNEEILKDIRSSIKLLMVDEFQDTSDVQFDIVRKLVGNGDLNEIKLIIVGDEKQSIYAFRNAEIRVFKQSKEYIKKINETQILTGKIKRDFNYAELTAIGEEKEGVISLNTSYRFLPHLSAFINYTNSKSFEYFLNNIEYDFFENIIKENSTEYEKFVYGLKAFEKYGSILLPDSDEIKELINENPIEFITYLKEPKNDTAISNQNNDDENEEDSIEFGEVSSVAIRIAELIASGTKAGDIGVISYTQVNFNLLSEKLTSLNIPNVNHGRNEFFTSREIKDIYTYLKFLIVPEYDINLAALLKSYFFLFSDEDILELSIIATENNQNTLLDKLYLATTRDNPKFKMAYDFLNNSLDNHIIYDFNGILTLLFENSLWHQTISSIGKEELVKQNLKLFKDAIDDFQNSNSKHLSDIIDYIFEMMHIEQNNNFKTEAQIDKEKVNMLTVHSSKGLDFDTLIVMDLGKRHKYFNLEGNYSKEYTYVFNSNFEKEKKVKTILSKLTSIEGNIIKKAEKIRLLYVAMTRVKTKLILSSTMKISDKGLASYDSNSFFNYIKDFLNEIDFTNHQDEKRYYNFKNKLKYSDSNNALVEIDVEYDVEKRYLNDEIINERFSKLTPLKIQNKEENQVTLAEHIPIKISKEDFTATKFKNINVYQSEYFKRYILNVPDNLFEKQYDFTDFEGRKVIDSAKKGNIVHSLMERMDSWLDENLEVNIDTLTELIEYNKKLFEFNDDVGNYFYDVCNNLASSLYLKQYQKYISKFQHELGLKMPLGKSFLSCVIDLCFLNNDTLEIWDWKTDKITSKNELNDKINSYQYQLKTYAFIAYFYFNKPNKIKAKLLFLDKLKENDVTNNWIKEFEWNSDEIISFEKEIKSSLQKANKMNFGIL